ncbi:MAG: flavin reductase [Chloroflexi bacterium]|nr:flavin reductase [Chloroflexota bacterium]|tara:strand:+ start:434 stop:1054 length:621 start_codon:yes stop_codon:yes gene_type:complete
MFYEPKNGYDLKNNPLNAIIIPRPIGWISTINSNGISNLAPYSFFNAVAYEPPQVMFASTSKHNFGGYKDAVLDAKKSGEFVVNIATLDLKNQMNKSSVAAPHNVDEFEYSGLTKAESKLVKSPRVAESPVNLECRYTNSISLLSKEGNDFNIVVFGEIIGVHIDDEIISQDRIDFMKLRAIGRLGYNDYVEINNFFSMERPIWDQ